MSLKPTRHTLVRDWKQDVVYIVQFPRLRVIPSASPFSLKVETFVRFNKLNYVVSTRQSIQGRCLASVRVYHI